jgi:hypothetical protein
MWSEHVLHLAAVTSGNSTGNQTAYQLRLPTAGDVTLSVHATLSGGDSTTKARVILQHSPDNVTWWDVYRSPWLNNVDTDATVGVILTSIAGLAKYVRTRREVTGTAPTSVVFNAALISSQPFTATALS